MSLISAWDTPSLTEIEQCSPDTSFWFPLVPLLGVIAAQAFGVYRWRFLIAPLIQSLRMRILRNMSFHFQVSFRLVVDGEERFSAVHNIMGSQSPQELEEVVVELPGLLSPASSYHSVQDL